ncbi:MAG: hypothetical protein FWC89_01865 [Defluviitaleaceae bacterium]|nr:hypothetical protein [Defluviitaleaceae bacterium]
MHINSSQASVLCQFQAKAAKFKELTGREIVVEKNDEGEFIHKLHPESTQKLSFFGEFFRVGFNSPYGFTVTLENLARKYAELQEELLERYSNQDELYKQLSDLNHAFENALLNSILTQPEKLQQVDSFFEIFIKSIQNSDFDNAFVDSMEVSNLFNINNLQKLGANPTPAATNEAVSERIFNVKGGRLIITTFADGTMRAEIVRGGNYGKTNAELGNVTDYENLNELQQSNNSPPLNINATPTVTIGGNE